MKLVTLKEAIESGQPFREGLGARYKRDGHTVRFTATNGAASFCNVKSLTEPVWQIIREPRTWFFNVYTQGFPKRTIYNTREEADSAATGTRTECIKVQEVIDSE